MLHLLPYIVTFRHYILFAEILQEFGSDLRVKMEVVELFGHHKGDIQENVISNDERNFSLNWQNEELPLQMIFYLASIVATFES